MRRLLGRVLQVLGAVCLAAGLMVGHGGAASALGPDRTAWWFEVDIGAPLPMPTVPSGGMLVQEGAAPAAYGAVHYPVLNGSAGTLLLTVASGSTAQASHVEACTTTQPWQAGSGPGPWASRPSYSTNCVVGVIATDASAVAFHLGPGMATAGLDLAIVPVGGSSPFSVTFAKPGPSSLQVDSPPPPLPAVSAPTTTPPAPQESTTLPPAVVSSPAPSSGILSSGAPAFTLPATTALTTAPTSPPQVELAAPASVAVQPPGDHRGQRVLAVFGLLGLVGGWWFVGSQPARSPRLIGAVGAESAPGSASPATRVGGVGRFARPRTTGPRRL